MDILESLKVVPKYDPEVIRSQQFSRLKGETYLDHAGAALHSDAQLAAVTSELSTCLLGNPHSRNRPSETSTQILHATRQRILQHFNTNDEEYAVIFTSGASAAIKLVAENLNWSSPCQESRHDGTTHCNCTELEPNNDKPWDSGKKTENNVMPPTKFTCYVYSQENHTSVLGVRGCAVSAGASVFSIPVKNIYEISKNNEINVSEKKTLQEDPDVENCLFAYSAQCNYSGAKYPLSWVQRVRDGMLDDFVDSKTGKSGVTRRWFVLLDAASFAATSPLDLSTCTPDFVPVSFYKMFGYPTGLGCLLLHRRAWSVLNKRYFGGGTVELADARSMRTVLRKLPSER
ncbi:hypothetical protein HAZT_HAZT003582 [Hyalella azteca]|uniref:Aminotransferase class V domain-containing protein n=1 Tax=Hyalella azteca TaxID=294128 RepID=A0A6A0H8G0_HYAAZ|nr:hypothetical protein HAZT_HAZT003582 [Hyalella azteca]